MTGSVHLNDSEVTAVAYLLAARQVGVEHPQRVEWGDIPYVDEDSWDRVAVTVPLIAATLEAVATNFVAWPKSLLAQCQNGRTGDGWYLDHKDRARRCACPPHLKKPAPEDDNQPERDNR